MQFFVICLSASSYSLFAPSPTLSSFDNFLISKRHWKWLTFSMILFSLCFLSNTKTCMIVCV